MQVNGRVVRDPEFPTRPGLDQVLVDGAVLESQSRVYLMLNKPRGLLTSARDEQGRDTVYRCFDGAGFPWLGPVGRLDKASEGLLLFSNDPQWAARVVDPQSALLKTYHVQIDVIPDAALLSRLRQGVVEDGEHLRAVSVGLLRSGTRNAWLEMVLDEGRNRQIRRLLAACAVGVLRLIRVAIGNLELGELAKGRWRVLQAEEVTALAEPSPDAGHPAGT